MRFTILFDDAFAIEFAALADDVQDQIRAYAGVLAEFGHKLGRPFADTLKGSKFPNMKELRITANKVEWRVAFAFDRQRRAILLAATPKGGKKDQLIYERLIKNADARFAAHQARLTARAGKSGKSSSKGASKKE